MRERRLANGMMILVIERHQHPVVSSMVWYRAGSRDEIPGRTGVSHFLEHMLFKGTARIAKGEIDAITARLGGSNNAFTDYDYTAYYFNFARDRWKTAFAIEADRMQHSALDPLEFEREKKVVLEEMRMGEDDPWRELAETVSSAAFFEHSYHHPVIGWKHDVAGLQRDAMCEYYKNYYSPNHAIAVVAGDVRAEDVFRAAKQYFGKLKPVKSVRPQVAPEEPQRGERRVFVERDTPIRRLMIACRGARFGTRDDYVLDVLAAALASGRSSILYKKLVKDKELAIHVSAENEARLDPGLFWISVETREGAAVDSVEECLFEEISKLQKTPLSSREMARARRLIHAGHALASEAVGEIADRVGRAAVLGDWKYSLNYQKNIDSVMPGEVRDAAIRILAPRNRTVGWSVPATDFTKTITTRAGGARSRGTRRHRRDATDAPPPAAISKFHVPQRSGRAPSVRLPFHREVLDNGIVLYITENPTAETVSFMAWANLGLSCEPEEKAGIENLTGSLLEEGSKRCSGDEIARLVDEAGGWLETGARGVTAAALADSLPLLLELSSGVLREPLFETSAFERVRGEILSDLIAEQDDLRGRAMRRLREEIYGKHPLHRPSDGYVHTVKKLKLRDVHDYYKKWYVPQSMILSISGDVDRAKARRLVHQHFGGWRGRAATPPPFGDIPAPRAARCIDSIEREQVHIAVGHAGIRRNNPDYYNLLVLDHILGTGSGFTDRISKKIRDERGLAYGVSANMTSTAGREPGIFAGYLSTEPSNAEDAHALLLSELRRITGEPPTEDEVRAAKDYLIGSHPFHLERNSSRAGMLIAMERHGLGADHVERYAARIEQVTRAEVERVAREYLFPDRCISVFVGPVAKAAKGAARSKVISARGIRGPKGGS